MELATERIRFLSTRRCRHFLAAIAPRLLQAIAATPDPDFTLVNLSKVSDSLGGKGVLWELFSFNPPTLQLYVELCSSSQYLSGILTSNPGMIDELMDSLLLDKLPTLGVLRSDAGRAVPRGGRHRPDPAQLQERAAAARRRARHPGQGDRSKPRPARCPISPRRACEQITQARVRQAGGQARRADDRRRAARPASRASWSIVALGKFGGRELNYYSDLDLMFLYEADGMTVHDAPLRDATRPPPTSISSASSASGSSRSPASLGPYGRLYEIDPRLRPTGKSGALATSLAEFGRYFAEGHGPALGAAGAVQSPRRVCARRGSRRTREPWCSERGVRPMLGSRRCRSRAADAGAAGRNRRRRATSSAGQADWSTSSSWCRCCSSSTATTTRAFACPARSRRCGLAD